MFRSKVVVITGASSGIGEESARAFDARGASVVLVARRKDRLEKIVSELKNSYFIEADLSDPERAGRVIDEVIERSGRIDILINNAASIIVSPFLSVTTDDLYKAFSVNLLSAVTATQKAIILMKKQGRGQIINIGSPGFMMGIPFYSPYVCSKAAFSAWTRTMQAENDDSRITISEYFPGYISTDSKPESRIGEIGQDFLMSPGQNFLTRTFAKPKTAAAVAKDLVKLAEKPRTLMYSGFGVRIGAIISNIPAFRLSLSKQMASTARNKIKQMK